jgi:hypothetical protein
MLQKKWWMTLGLVAVLGFWMAPASPAFDDDCDKDENDESELVVDCDGDCEEDEEGTLLADCTCGEGGCDGDCKDGEEEEAELLADCDGDCEDEEEESELLA